LWDSGVDKEMSFDELVGKLRSRFGSTGCHERFAAELRARRRKNNESLAELHADVKRLMALAYPQSSHSELGQIIARNHFISALRDREMELKIRDRDPVDLDKAYEAAIRIETHLRAYEAEKEREVVKENKYRRERYETNRVRQTIEAKKYSPQPPVNKTDPTVAQLFNQLENSQKENNEMSKELSRFRLLNEQTKLSTPLANAAPDPDASRITHQRHFPPKKFTADDPADVFHVTK